MFALRRASLSLRRRGISSRVSTATRMFGREEFKTSGVDSPDSASEKCVLFCGFRSENGFSAKAIRGFSSQTGAESSGDEGGSDLEDGFSELESDGSDNASCRSDDKEDELVSELEIIDIEPVDSAKTELGIVDSAEADLSEKVWHKRKVVSELFKVIAGVQGPSIHDALDKWVEEGNKVGREEIALAMLDLRKFRLFGKALQFSEWLESSKSIEFHENDYSSRVDLIAKVHGLDKAERYIEQIPDSFRGELVYRSLLVSSVYTFNVAKSEEIFNKIKGFKGSISSFTCDQMLLLYRRNDNKKVADVLLFMEENNVKPSLFTYRLLIDIKGQYGDIAGMEHILETMKADGIAPDRATNSTIVRHYFKMGYQEKAKAVLKQMEKGNLNENRHLCRVLIGLYADIGLADEVDRVWKICESNPRAGEYIQVIEAFGKLKRIEEAEAVFEQMAEVVGKLNAVHYNGLLKAYANCHMLTKGKELIKRMIDDNCRIGPTTLDLVVKLYVDAGEVEKADSILHKTYQQKSDKPLFSSYITIMDQYAKRGDVHNAEKIYMRLKQAGYLPRLRQFQSLVNAYVNAKAPFYGVRDRMKADNIFPNKSLSAQLPLIDGFRKTPASDLLD